MVTNEVWGKKSREDKWLSPVVYVRDMTSSESLPNKQTNPKTKSILICLPNGTKGPWGKSP